MFLSVNTPGVTEQAQPKRQECGIVTRQQAIRLGIKRYFTGKPCLRGHISERYTTMAKCIACDNEDHKKK